MSKFTDRGTLVINGVGYSGGGNIVKSGTKDEIQAKIDSGLIHEGDIFAITDDEDINYIPTEAKNITYDNSTSELTATDAQAAIDELANKSTEIKHGTQEEIESQIASGEIVPGDTFIITDDETTEDFNAGAVYYHNETSGIEATNVQDAVDEIVGRLSHIGMIIQSTTLDTEEKVKAIYGGNTWTRLDDMFLVGAGTLYEVNSTGGEATHTLTVDEIPSHSHETPLFVNAETTTMGIFGRGNAMSKYVSSSTTEDEFYMSDSDKTAEHNETALLTNTTGGGQAHNNLPPYKAVYIWERTE